MGAEIRFADVTQTFRSSRHPDAEVTALRKVDLCVPSGGFVAVAGGPGSGKTALLDLAAGLTRPSQGSVLVGGDPVDGPSPQRSTVLRQFTLLPWRTVRQNVEFALEASGAWTKPERVDLAESALALLGIGSSASSYPSDLDPGTKQRVALARALSTQPEVLILDEPFADIDEPDRSRLRADLVELWQALGLTVLFATTDLAQALSFGQRTVVLESGRISRVYQPAGRAAA